MKKVATYVQIGISITKHDTNCHVESLEWVEKGLYGVVRDSDGYILVMGKEIKGYVGDIIYLQYADENFASGDYILKSDRHGMICKWKEFKISGKPKSFEEAIERFCDALENNLNR